MAEANTSVLANPQNMQQWMQVLEGLFPQSTQTNSSQQSTTQNSSAADQPLMAMIQQLMAQMGQGVGNPQIQALLAPIFAQLRDVALPQIQGLANAGGGVYNSSTQKLLAGDALARATAQGGQVVVGQQNELQKQITNLLNILAQSTRTTNQAQQGTQNQSRSGQAGNAAKLGAAAGAAKAAAKAIKRAMTTPASAAGGTGEDDEAMARMAMNAGGEGRSDASDDTSGLGFSGEGDYNFGPGEYNYGDGNGLDFYAFPEDPGVDPFGIGGWDDNWGAEEGSGFGETGESVSGFWGGDSGGGTGGFGEEPEFEDLGENF